MRTQHAVEMWKKATWFMDGLSGEEARRRVSLGKHGPSDFSATEPRAFQVFPLKGGKAKDYTITVTRHQ